MDVRASMLLEDFYRGSEGFSGNLSDAILMKIVTLAEIVKIQQEELEALRTKLETGA